MLKYSSTYEINGEQHGHLTVTNAFRKKVNSTLSANAAAEMSVRFGMTVYYPGKRFPACINKKNLYNL